MEEHPLEGSDARVRVDGMDAFLATPEGDRLPIGPAVLSLTSRCNLDCAMCLDPAVSGPVTDLPFQEALRFVDLFGGRVRSFWTCAGEALMHPRFLDLAREIQRRGSHLGVGTNGLVLSQPGLLDRLQSAGVRTLHVSAHTCRPDRYREIMGARTPDAFGRFDQAMEALDGWNRDHPDRAIEVLLQVVLMRPFADEAGEWFDWARARFAHSPLVVRLEPMQRVGRGRENPGLLLDAPALQALLSSILSRYAGEFRFRIRSVPLCLLEGHEHLSDDLPDFLGVSIPVGNRDCSSGALRLQCPVGDPRATPFWDDCCRACSLSEACCGMMQIPVPAGSPWPRASSLPAREVARRAGLDRPEVRRHPLTRQNTLFKATGTGPDAGDRTRFSPGQLALVRRVVETLAAADPAGVADGTEFRVELVFPGDGGGPPGILVMQPAGPGVARLFEVAGIAVGYRGDLTPGLDRRLQRVRDALRSGEAAHG